MTWGALFERAAPLAATETTVADALGEIRDHPDDGGDGAGDDPPESADPTRVVADADVLAADLLVGDAARRALDRVREHSWTTLVASDPLLSDARAVVERLTGDDALTAAWHDRVREERVAVEHPAGDHPALASAYRGGAAHVLSFDDRLTTARAGLSVQPHLSLSVRTPAAFVAVFDPAALYESAVGETYRGADRDPRD